MKRVMNTTPFVITFFCILSMPSVFNAADNTNNNPQQQQTVKEHILSVIKEKPNINDLLLTILDNAQFVVEQIKSSKYNAVTRKEALSAIKKAQKQLLKLSTTPLLKKTYHALSTHVTAIEKEAHAFAKHQSYIRKYNSANAEKHLQDLIHTIKNATENLSESFVTQQYQQLEQAIIDTENIIKDSQAIINNTNADFAAHKISPVEAAHTIGKQKNSIVQAQKNLEHTKQQALANVANNDEQTSYLEQFTTTASSLGKQIIAPFKSGYGYTEQEKDIARAIIVELEKEQKRYITLFNKLLSNPALTESEKTALVTEYTALMNDFNNEIYHQQLITGDVMSFNRKLFWAAVGFAGAIGGAYLGYQYFSQAPEITKTNDSTTQPSTKTPPSIAQKEHITKPSIKLETDTPTFSTSNFETGDENTKTPPIEQQPTPEPKQSPKNMYKEDQEAIYEHKIWKAQQQTLKEQDNGRVQQYLQQQRQKQQRRESKSIFGNI